MKLKHLVERRASRSMGERGEEIDERFQLLGRIRLRVPVGQIDSGAGKQPWEQSFPSPPPPQSPG